MTLHICPSSFSSIKGVDEEKLSFEWLGVKDNWRQSNMKKFFSYHLNWFFYMPRHCRALVDLFIAVQFVSFPIQGSPFPSCVVEILMLQTTHIPNSRRCNLGCLPSESEVAIIKVHSPKLPFSRLLSVLLLVSTSILEAFQSISATLRSMA
jgi:hypothetical protein